MSWEDKETEKIPGKAIVILDGKNTPGDLHAQLTRDRNEKLPIYVFFANSDGSHTTVKPGKSMYKSGDYSVIIEPVKSNILLHCIKKEELAPLSSAMMVFMQIGLNWPKP